MIVINMQSRSSNVGWYVTGYFFLAAASNQRQNVVGYEWRPGTKETTSTDDPLAVAGRLRFAPPLARLAGKAFAATASLFPDPCSVHSRTSHSPASLFASTQLIAIATTTIIIVLRKI
jgi:hypothetical protein